MATSDEPPITERVSQLASEAWATQARIVRESLHTGRQAWASDTDKAAFGKAWVDTVATQGQRYWQELASMGIEMARDLIMLNARTSAAVLTSLSEAAAGRAASSQRTRFDGSGPPESTFAKSAGPARSTAERGSAVVTLTGPSGSTAHGSLTVVNRHPRARRIDVVPSALRDAVNDEPCQGSVEVEPARVTVPSGKERRIELSAVLDPQLFTPGRAYTGAIQVSGGEQATVTVVVSASQS
ncbi:MAG: hypothetical protein ACOYBY_16835 [Dermatophilaceae bacterium]